MKEQTGSGSQTLMRGLDVIEGVARGEVTLAQLSSRLALTRSTTHRLAAALVERGYLGFAPREGYRLGAKLLELGHLAREQTDIIQTARPHIEALARATCDTVHLGVLDEDLALYLDKVPGRRRITISSRIGDRQPLTSTGLGKALMLDHTSQYWRERVVQDRASGAPVVAFDQWEERMNDYVAAGRTFDLEENEDQIRCVAAPIRDASNRIIGAISVSSAAQYMDDARMEALSGDVLTTARAISADLGWQEDNPQWK
jgi:DNA-binding IclR family transcriptional regulator